MKKRIIIIVSASALTLIIIAGIIGIALSKADNKSPLPETDSTEQTESVTKEKEEHYVNPNYSSLPGTVKETEPETEHITEKETETETEKQTEEQTEEKKQETGLIFVSNGNGTCSLSGIGDCTDTCVIIPERSPTGDIVTSISDRVFYGRENITAIQIPSTISSIGEMAFGDCKDLMYISVMGQNRNFKDLSGVLYTIDESVLVAYPQAKEATCVTIPKTVTKILPMAFYNCDNLKSIDFQGTQQQWASLDIGAFNYGLYIASVKCIDTK